MSTVLWLAGLCGAYGLAGRAALIDLREGFLPNQLVGRAAALSWITLGGVMLAYPSGQPLVDVAKAVGIVAVPFLVVWLIAPAAVGAGDVKLVLALAPTVAWPTSRYAFLGLLAMFVLAMPQALRQRGESVRFGPYIVAGLGLAAVLTIATPT